MTPLELGWHGAETWDWLVASPLFGVTLTLGAYGVGRWAHRRTGHPALQPVVVAIALVSAVLLIADVDYDQYLAGGSYIGFWLGPATVALALPLHQEWHLVRRAALPILAGVVAGATVSVFAAIWATEIAGGSRELQLTMAPKAATTPVSLALSAQIGGIPALTAVVTIIAGITGAILGPWLLDRLRVTDLRARGVALGTVGHGISTARALQESRTEGAFSALSMALSALATSALVPIVVGIV